MAKPVENIVVGVAALRNDPILRPALELARRLDATLHVVHSFEIPHPILNVYQRLGVREPLVVERYGRSLQASLTTEVESVAEGASVQSRAVCGSSSQVLCAAIEEVGADLVVVGATRQGPMMRHILGSTADRVIRAASAPVLVLRPPFATSVSRVLLTTDLSTVSAAVLEHATGLADALAGSATPALRCLLVTWYDVDLPPPLHREGLEEVAGLDLESFLREQLGDREIEARVRVGDPPKEIVTEAADWMADLVVVGTHGHEGVSRYLLGSVAASVLRSAMGNVLVIPAGAIERARDRRASGEMPAGTT